MISTSAVTGGATHTLSSIDRQRARPRTGQHWHESSRKAAIGHGEGLVEAIRLQGRFSSRLQAAAPGLDAKTSAVSIPVDYSQVSLLEVFFAIATGLLASHWLPEHFRITAFGSGLCQSTADQAEK